MPRLAALAVLRARVLRPAVRTSATRLAALAVFLRASVLPALRTSVPRFAVLAVLRASVLRPTLQTNAARLAALAVLLLVGDARDGAAQGPGDASPPAQLAALAPIDDDARTAVAIGTNGEVYAPDGKGAWTRTQRISTSKRIAHVARAGANVVAFGEGVVFRLAPNGWSAIRLHQKDRAIMSNGPRAIAAVGRQLFVLDETADGEPKKLVVAPSNVIALGAGPAPRLVVQTDNGLFRLQNNRLVAIKPAPAKIERLVGDRWALVAGGAIDLDSGRKTGWPPNTTILVAAMMADRRLVLVAQQGPRRELVVLGTKLERTPIDIASSAAPPVGAAVDTAGRAIVALADGALLVRANGAWTTVRVGDLLAGAKPGPAPARSP